MHARWPFQDIVSYTAIVILMHESLHPSLVFCVLCPGCHVYLSLACSSNAFETSSVCWEDNDLTYESEKKYEINLCFLAVYETMSKLASGSYNWNITRDEKIIRDDKNKAENKAVEFIVFWWIIHESIYRLYKIAIYSNIILQLNYNQSE